MNKLSLSIAAILISASATFAHESEPVIQDPATGTTTPISQFDMSGLTQAQIAGIASQLRSTMSEEEITRMLEQHPNMTAMATEMQREVGNMSTGPASNMAANSGGSMGAGHSGGDGSGGGMGGDSSGGGMGGGMGGNN